MTFAWNEAIQEMNTVEQAANELNNLLEEEDFDKETYIEMNAISSMMKVAIREHLETEVIYHYGQFRAAGESVVEATNHAIGEWIK